MTRRAAGREAGEAIAVAGVRVIIHGVRSEADGEGVGGRPLRADAEGVHVLVVVLVAGVEVGAVAVARIERERPADDELIPDRQRAGEDAVHLVV